MENQPEIQQPGKKPEEEKNQFVKEIQKEIPRPWEKIEKEEEERIIGKYISKIELSKESQKFIEDSLKEEGERRTIEFAKKWFEEHREDLRAEGISLEVSEERKIGIALEKGALEDLKTKEEYKQIEGFNALRFGLREKYLPIESQFLLLNFLDKKGDKIKEEIEGMKKDRKPIEEIAIKQRELDRLFEVQKELAQKVSGRDLEEEVKKEGVSTKIKQKEEYVKAGLKNAKAEVIKEEELKLFEEEWQKLSESEKEKYENNPLNFAESRIESICRQLEERKIKIDKKECLALLFNGYNPEEFRRGGFLGRKIETKKGKLISKSKLFEEFLEEQEKEFSEKTEKKAKENLEKQWARKELEDKIKELAESPEMASEKIEGVYRKVKDRLLAEWVERDLKKEPKEKEKLEKIEKEFNKTGKNPREFIEDVLSRKGPLGELTGDLEKDKEKLLEFFEDYGLKLKEKDIKTKINPEKYKEMVKRERGFLDLLLEFVFIILTILAIGVMAVEKKMEKGQK